MLKRNETVPSLNVSLPTSQAFAPVVPSAALSVSKRSRGWTALSTSTSLRATTSPQSPSQDAAL